MKKHSDIDCLCRGSDRKGLGVGEFVLVVFEWDESISYKERTKRLSLHQDDGDGSLTQEH